MNGSRSGRNRLARAAILGWVPALLIAAAGGLVAQGHPGAVLEASFGWAGFVDNATINHWISAGGGRFYLTPRLGVGPEIVYMRGPTTDRDIMATGNLTFDLLPSDNGVRQVNPYLVVGAGLFQHREDLSGGTFTSRETGLTGGGGVRVFLTDRFYLAPEVRLGWELHVRTSLALGFRF